LLVVPESPFDNDKEFIVYGEDYLGRELYHLDENGDIVQGYKIPVTTATVPTYEQPQVVKRIVRITKEAFLAPCRLFAFDVGTGVSTMLGYYYPDELEPTYQRIKVPKSQTIRIMYKRKRREIISPDDFIPINSKTAVLLACKAINMLHSGNRPAYKENLAIAIELLNNEPHANTVNDGIGSQYQDFTSGHDEIRT
jgi:hypothetical protein